jgi:hypothetical protein
VWLGSRRRSRDSTQLGDAAGTYLATLYVLCGALHRSAGPVAVAAETAAAGCVADTRGVVLRLVVYSVGKRDIRALVAGPPATKLGARLQPMPCPRLPPACPSMPLVGEGEGEGEVTNVDARWRRPTVARHARVWGSVFFFWGLHVG